MEWDRQKGEVPQGGRVLEGLSVSGRVGVRACNPWCMNRLPVSYTVPKMVIPGKSKFFLSLLWFGASTRQRSAVVYFASSDIFC